MTINQPEALTLLEYMRFDNEDTKKRLKMRLLFVFKAIEWLESY